MSEPPHPQPGPSMSERHAPAGEDDGRIGIFPSWKSLYVSVLVYTAALIVLLYVLTVLFDHSLR
jgi:hypothetical protein